MDCAICGKKIAETFLKKIIGSYVKDEKGKQHAICNECQTKYKTKKEMVDAL